MKIVINPDYIKYKSFIENIADNFEKSGTVIYKGRNILKRFDVEDQSFVVKSFCPPHIINRFVYVTFRKSKASRSYENGLRLLENGFQTPAPVAYIEEKYFGLKRSYYITEEIKETHEIREFWFQPEIGDRYPILKAFAQLSADLHKKKIIHKDYSSGNILYVSSEKKLDFYLVDINRMRFGQAIKEEEAYKNFSKLWLPEETYRYIAECYAEAMGYDKVYAVERILFYKNEFMRRKS